MNCLSINFIRLTLILQIFPVSVAPLIRGRRWCIQNFIPRRKYLFRSRILPLWLGYSLSRFFFFWHDMKNEMAAERNAQRQDPSTPAQASHWLMTREVTQETLSVAAPVVRPLPERRPCLPRTPLPLCPTFHLSPTQPRQVDTVRSSPALRTWPLCPGELVSVRLHWQWQRLSEVHQLRSLRSWVWCPRLTAHHGGLKGQLPQLRSLFRDLHVHVPQFDIAGDCRACLSALGPTFSLWARRVFSTCQTVGKPPGVFQKYRSGRHTRTRPRSGSVGAATSPIRLELWTCGRTVENRSGTWAWVRPQVSLVTWAWSGKHYGLPKVVFGSGGRVVLPTMFPFPRVHSERRRGSGSSPQLMESWPADEAFSVQNAARRLQLAEASLWFSTQVCQDFLCCCRQTVSQHWQSIGPRCPVSARCSSSRGPKTQSSQSHWKCGDVPCCRDLFLCARKGAQQCRHGLEHPFVMYLAGCDGDTVLSTWWHRGPAHCSNNCQAHCKSGTDGIAFHNLRSSSSLLSVKAWMNASDPIGDPNIRTPNFFTQVVDVLGSDPAPVPNAGLPRVQLDPCACLQRGVHDVIQGSRSLWERQDVHLEPSCSCLPPMRCAHPDWTTGAWAGPLAHRLRPAWCGGGPPRRLPTRMWWSPRKQILRGLGVQGFPEVWPASRSDTRDRKLPHHQSKSLSRQGWHQSTLWWRGPRNLSPLLWTSRTGMENTLFPPSCQIVVQNTWPRASWKPSQLRFLSPLRLVFATLSWWPPWARDPPSTELFLWRDLHWLRTTTGTTQDHPDRPEASRSRSWRTTGWSFPQTLRERLRFELEMFCSVEIQHLARDCRHRIWWASSLKGLQCCCVPWCQCSARQLLTSSWHLSPLNSALSCQSPARSFFFGIETHWLLASTASKVPVGISWRAWSIHLGPHCPCCEVSISLTTK